MNPSKKASVLPVLLLLLTLTGLPCLDQPAQAAKYERSLETYTIPDVELINQQHQQVRSSELLNSGQPVLVDFIYATCTTICPVLSAGFSNLQKKLGEEAREVRFVSFSIDPEYDKPEIMREYLERYRAKPGWDFLTGTRADIDKIMHAFDAYVSNKMSHYPLILIKTPNQDEWVRIYGLVGTRDLMEEFRRYYPAKGE